MISKILHDDLININYVDLNNILLDEKSNNVFYDVAYQTTYDAKSSCITFDKINRYIKEYVRTKYLSLFYSEKYERVFNRIRCLLYKKSF